MKLGQKVIRTPLTFYDSSERQKGEPARRPMSGKVVYIHPQGRYHVVEFETPLGAVRESFLGVPE